MSSVSLFFDTIVATLGVYSDVTIFLLPLLAGEAGVLLLAFVYSGNVDTLLLIGGWSWIAMTIMDTVWFLVPRLRWFRNYYQKRMLPKRMEEVQKRINVFAKERVFLVLSLAKLLVGTRVLFVMYLGAQAISLMRFIGTALLVNLLWSATMVGIGFIARSSFDYALHLFQNVQVVILILLLAGLLSYTALKHIRRYLLTASSS